MYVQRICKILCFILSFQALGSYRFFQLPLIMTLNETYECNLPLEVPVGIRGASLVYDVDYFSWRQGIIILRRRQQFVVEDDVAAGHSLVQFAHRIIWRQVRYSFPQYCLKKALNFSKIDVNNIEPIYLCIYVYISICTHTYRSNT